MTNGLRPVLILTYNGVADVSNEISDLITAVDYTDNVAGKSDELQITVANYDLRWLNGWYPSDGDRLELTIGYDDQPLLPCGVFKIDKIDMNGTADVVTLHALAAGMTQVVRTKQSRAFETTTLADIAGTIARELQLTLAGDIGDITIQRVTMDQETTLAFLRRLAEDYGYAFSIRDTMLSFYEIAALEKSPPVLTIKRSDLKPGYRFSSKTMGTYVACEVTFFDPATAKNIVVKVDAEQARPRVVLNTSATNADGSKPPQIPTRNLTSGVTGDDVRAWQDFLSSHGYDSGATDGIFGPKTRAATIAFQRAGGLTPDGIAGPESFRVAVGQGFNLRTAAGVPTGTRNEIAGNVLRETIRVESVAQAELKAKALLAAANRLKATGTLTVPGNTKLCAGVTIDLEDMGRLSGRYHITSSKHRMSKGYETEIEVTFVP